MSRILVLVLIAWSLNCGDKKSAQEPPATKMERDPKTPTLVSMTPQQQTAAGVVIEPIVEGSITETDDLPGSIEAQSGALVIVNARSAGVIDSLAVDVGDRVKAGQQLATIRSLDLAEAQAAYHKALVADRYAAAALERAEGLEQDGVISQKRLDADQQQAKESKLAVEEGEKRIRLLGGGLGDTSGIVAVTSPIAGSVAVRKVNRGESVPENAPLLTVVDASRIVVQFRALAGTPVVEGTKVAFSIDAAPDHTFECSVKTSSDLVDPETRRFLIRCAIENKDGILKPGMFITGHLPRAAVRALTVPEDAVQMIDGKPSLFIAKANDGFEPRIVDLGPHADGRVAVTKGIVLGERVVTKGAFFVRTQFQKSELEE